MTVGRGYFLSVIGPHDHINDFKVVKFEEESLLDALGIKVINKFFQHRITHDRAYYFGSGKISLVLDQARKDKPDLVYLNDVLDPALIFRVEKKFWEVNYRIKVWDRIDLILEVFDKNAVSVESKLQIELARLKHLGPRVYGLGLEMSQQMGRIGVRAGFGETILEKMRRHIKKRINKIEKDLERINIRRLKEIEGRKIRNLKTVSLVGYTNAGKTTLFNLLTGKNKKTQNQPFTTLETVVGRLRGLRNEVLVSDTIGFISSLPPSLIETFKTTLMETLRGELILVIVDISDKHWLKKLMEVEKILFDQKIIPERQIFVFNKIDLLGKINKPVSTPFLPRKIFMVSAKTGEGVNNLIEFINEYFSNNYSCNC